MGWSSSAGWNSEGWSATTSAAIAPPAMTNLWSWVKAGSGVFQDSGLSTPATADGNPVGGWVDQTGNSRNWLQSTSASRPTLKLSIINGQPVVRFVAGSPFQFLNGPNPSALTEGEIWIVVAALDATGAAATGGMWSFGTGTGDVVYPFTDLNIYDDFGSTLRSNQNPSVSLSSFHLYNVISTSSLWQMYMDGNFIKNNVSNTVGWTSTPYLGQAFSQSSAFSGDIAEVLFYSAALSAPDRVTSKAYIAAKYGLTIS